MDDLNVGRAVFSKAGRDRGGAFIIIKTEGEYAYIADGELRKFEKPKKKKIKHLQPINHTDGEVINKIKDGTITDQNIREALKQFRKGGRTNGEGRCDRG